MTEAEITSASGRRILLGVAAGIAAYKSAELVRLLVKQGHQVRVVMTAGAKAFVAPMTFQALSGHPVRDSLLDPAAEAGMGHIELARWAELVLIAPATADMLARLAAGMADDLLTTLCLASAAPIALAPAMNQAMWRNGRTQRNLQQLQADGQFIIWGPDDGEQACGDVGPGRMLAAEALAANVAHWCEASASPDRLPDLALQGQRWVITAGPTREALDPVRYLSNNSSGKMGFALAAAAQAAGAHVLLIAGPVQLATPAGVTRIDVESAAEMDEQVQAAVAQACDVFVAAAAVADYRPEQVAPRKIKKSAPDLQLRLVRNPDILAGVAANPRPPFTVGFAAETHDVAHYARDKLQRKRLKMIVANDVSDARIGFNSPDNAVTVFWQDGEQHFAQMDKRKLATALVALIAAVYHARH